MRNSTQPLYSAFRPTYYSLYILYIVVWIMCWFCENLFFPNLRFLFLFEKDRFSTKTQKMGRPF